MMTRRLLTCSSLLLAIALTAVGCGSGGKKATTTVSPPIEPVSFTIPVSSVHFADFTPVPLVGPDSPAYAGPATPHSLADVTISADLKPDLKQVGVTDALEKNGFVVVPSGLTRFYFAYQGNVYSGWPLFVTTDAAYHEWHLTFDKLLRDLEQEVLLPKLEEFVSGSLEAAQAQANELKGTPLEDSAARAEELFQVAASELGQSVSLGNEAEREKVLIDEHAQSRADSPILGVPVDYSLFTPRGHYVLNAQLKRYFTTMSVLGQLPFCLPGTTDCPGDEPARIGILASRAIDRNSRLVTLWKQIYEPTAFLVGMADDYTPLDVEQAAKDTASGGLDDASAFESDSTVEALVQELVAARPVQINPERASIRLMGVRFVLDSYILDQLVSPNVGTNEKPRLTPSALDLAASFGSGYAKQLLDEQGVAGYANYDEQLQKVQKIVSSRPQKDWGSTVYDAWLYALEPMFVSHGKAFPDFMRSDAWAAKALQTGFGSYAELKHDTILMAKQYFAEGGDGLKPQEPPRNWVEPDPAAFGRMVEAMKLLQTGLSDRSLLTPKTGKLLDDEIELQSFFQRIATDELAGLPISAADNDRLRHIGDELEALWWRTTDLTNEGGAPTGPDAYHDAVIADIGSSPKGVLEVGTGPIDWIYVIVPDDQGNFQLAVGGVYSYYEFTNPPGQRLTDQEWRAKFGYDKKPPARPDWETVFLPAGNVTSQVFPPG
jgi:hypothetical protein